MFWNLNNIDKSMKKKLNWKETNQENKFPEIVKIKIVDSKKIRNRLPQERSNMRVSCKNL